MTPASCKANSVAHIEHILKDWAEAIRAKNSKGLISHFSPDALIFDLINPLQYAGIAALEKRAEEWLSGFQGPVEYENEELRVTADDEAGFCHSINHVKGTTAKGKIDMRWRATVCFSKLGGRWMVTHEHSSVPFDMETGKASLDLKA